MEKGLDIGFRLDRRWHLLRGEPMDTKEDDLLAVARLLNRAGLEWALIGGLAVQIHAREPRTTLDIELAVRARALLPRAELLSAGFAATGEFDFTESWRGPAGTPVQFSDEGGFADALRTAESLDQSGVVLRVISKLELVRAKLRAAADPGRRRTKAPRDLVDLETLLEENPDLGALLRHEDRARLAAARARVQA